jgi:hypothetical protein
LRQLARIFQNVTPHSMRDTRFFVAALKVKIEVELSGYVYERKGNAECSRGVYLISQLVRIRAIVS